jgi:hypothetical protein
VSFRFSLNFDNREYNLGPAKRARVSLDQDSRKSLPTPTESRTLRPRQQNTNPTLSTPNLAITSVQLRPTHVCLFIEINILLNTFFS